MTLQTHLPFPSSLNLPDAPTKDLMDRHGYEADVPLSAARTLSATNACLGSISFWNLTV